VIGGIKEYLAVVFRLLRSYTLSVYVKLYVVCAGINLNFRCISVTAIPGPAFHGIGHFPCGRGMSIFCMVYRHNCDCQVFQFKSHSCISHLAKRLSGKVNSSGTSSYPAAAAIEARCIILVLPGSDSNLSKVILCCPHKITDNTFVSFGFLHKLISICTESLASQNHSLRIFLQVMTVTLDSIVVSGYVHVGVSISCFYITRIKSCSCFHKSSAENSSNCVIKFTSNSLFLLGIFCCFICLFITVNTESHRT